MGGAWRAGTTSIDVAIDSWGGDCGPRPQSTKSTGGGLVSVEQRDQVLLVHGRDQDIRSDSCWSRNPAMKRTNSSFQSGVWTTRCQTAKNDPRAEQGTYTLKLVSDDTLLYQDVSHYDWSLNTSKCVATFTTSQTLSRSGKGSKAEPSRTSKPPVEQPQTASTPPVKAVPVTQPAPAPEERACVPGAPSQLSLRPRRADIEVGQRVCFRARVTDASDCLVKSATVEWTMSAPRSLRGSLTDTGCFTAAETAAEAQGEFRVTASSGKLSSDAVVAVRPTDLSALIAKRLESSGLTGFEEQPELPTSQPKAVARIATHTTTQPSSSGRSLFVAGLGVLAVALAGLGFWFSRRSRPAPAAESGSFPAAALASESVGSARPAPAADTSEEEPWICPSCRVGYPAHQGTCPKDGSLLMRYADFAKQGRRHDEEHVKRCPTCGSTYPANASFCGADGANLVDV